MLAHRARRGGPAAGGGAVSRAPRAALAALALGLALLAASCGGDEAGETPTPTATPVDPAAIVLESADAMDGVERFHFLLEHDNGASEIVRGIMMVRAEGAFDGADRMTAEIEGELGPVKFETGIIVLPGESWLRNPLTQRWEREDISIEVFFDPQDGLAALLRQVRGPVLEGREDVRGVETYRIAVTADSGDLAIFPTAEPGFEVATTLWLGIEDRLIHRVHVRGPISADESPDIVRRLELSRYGEAVDIAPPR